MNDIHPLSFNVENTQITMFIENNIVYRHDRLFSAPHIHPIHEMYIVLDGELIVNPKTPESFYLSQNEGCVFLPFYYHNSISVSDVNTKRLAIKFIFKKIKNLKSEIDFYGILNYAFNYSDKMTTFNIEQNILNDIVSHSKDLTNEFNIIILKNIFSLIFIKIAEQNQEAFYEYKKTNPSVSNYTPSDSIESTIRFINIDYFLEKYTNGQITFSEIAKNLYISTKQLSRIISEKFDKNPKNFFFEYKMKRAEFFLSETDYSIKDIAEFIGYSSANTFTIMFKKYTNISPSDYRKQFR